MKIKSLALAIFQSLDIARDQAIFDEFVSIETLLNSHEELQSVLNDNSVDINTKAQILINIFEKLQISEFPTKILKFLISKKSPELLSGLGSQLQSIIKEYKNITDLRIYSSQELSEQEINSIKESIDFIQNKDNIEVNNIVDESLIAGVRVETDEYVLDKSCKLFLEDLEKSLK